MLFFNFLFIEKSESSKSWFPQKYEAALLYNNKILEHQISIYMISEGSCDTKDWSKGCWKFSFASQEYITF